MKPEFQNNLKRILIATVLGLLIFLAFILKDYLPPRTPIKIARIQSGLNIPMSSKVIDFKEDYTFNGEGQIEIKLELDSLDLNTITKECLESDFKELTIDNLIADGFLDTNPQFGFFMPNTDLRNINDGYYKLRAIDLKKLDFTITVLNLDKNELSIWTLIP